MATFVDRTGREQSGTVQDVNERKSISVLHAGGSAEIGAFVAPDKLQITAVTFVPTSAVINAGGAKSADVKNRGTAGLGVGTGPTVENIVGDGALGLGNIHDNSGVGDDKAALERVPFAVLVADSADAGRTGIGVNDVVRDEVVTVNANEPGEFIIEYETAGYAAVVIDSTLALDSQGNPNFVPQPVTPGVS